MILKEGKMTSRELAEWFGVTYNTYKNDIPRKLKILEDYCSFEKVYGGVIISDIYVEEFSGLTIDDELLMKELENNYNKTGEWVYSISGIAKKFLQIYPEVYTKSNGNIIGLRGLEKRLSKARERCIPYIKDDDSNTGAYGNSKRVWAIKLGELNEYRYLTKAEEEIFDRIIGEYYVTKDGIEAIKEKELLREAFLKGEITDDMYKEELKGKGDFFFHVLIPFREKTGMIITKASEARIKKSYKYFSENGFKIDEDTGEIIRE